MLRQLQKRIIWSAVVLCLAPVRSIAGQEDTKTPKKPQTIDVQIEVTDEKNGSPLNSVQVLVKWGKGESGSQKAEAVTNQAGIAKVKDIPRGIVTIRLIANGYKTVAPAVDLKTEKQPIKIALQKAAPPT